MTTRGAPGPAHASVEASLGVLDLAATWRAHAATLRAFGAAPQAEAVERCAAQLEAALAADADAVLTLAEAVLASGTPERTLRAMLADGRLVNRGRKGKPLIRRADLPHRPAKPAPEAAAGAPRPYDVAADALALLRRQRAS